ncbi:hypothetical protein SAMN04489761_0986 [Tenacibaculum sp. MAR_2009_124]|uniref:hypothetical protein n=1 Tax=Tenacibaculum sp. MAR_2009_124 TaxID=1250059 RepID=UPI0008963C19|nr:hypothetical protein [Tenacibaculum sp. MAR_2009_124]SEB48512.1 hypothetical protein SAMN04489761_0986 [Tenacibaculum sp. MAR_2009_124]
MEKLFIRAVIILFIYSFSSLSVHGQDYLVTINNDTVYGKIEWKTNTTVFVKNRKGKRQFKANQAKLFKRGSFIFYSINTGFPEYLLEVKKGIVSYYKESHLKSRYTLDYKKHVYLKYNDTLFPIKVKSNAIHKGYASNTFFDVQRANVHRNISYKNGDLYKKRYLNDKYSLNFKLCFSHILGIDNVLVKLIYNDNYTFEDIEQLVDLSNEHLKGKNIVNYVNPLLDKKYGAGYIITKKKDTIHGSIKLTGRFSIKNKVNFLTKAGEEIVYRPTELSEFSVNRRIYKNIVIKKKPKLLKELIKGEISLYRDLKKRRNYATKDLKVYSPVDKKENYLNLFKTKPSVYNRIIKNNYQYFEVKSMIKLYNSI